MDFHRGRIYPYNLVPAIDYLALAGNEHIIAFGEKNFLWFSGMTGKSEKLQWNWRSGRRRWYTVGCLILFVIRSAIALRRGNLHVLCLCHENVSPRTFVLDLLGGSKLREVQCGVKALRSPL